MKRRTALSVALLVALSPVAVARPAAAVDSPSADQQWESVVVNGQGDVFGTPDTLDASFAVETSATTVGEALKQANTAATRMRDALDRGGVAKADRQTSNVNINSTRKDDGTITGYSVNQGLTAKIRKLPRASALISATVQAGGDAARINGVSFAIEDNSALVVEARKKAFADARKKADLYAREAGRTLGRVLKVSESGPTSGGWGAQDKYVAADASVPIEPGRQRLTATVTVEWALAG